jgi:hypothetical protein
VTGDFGSAVKGKQAVAEQPLVSWLLDLDPLCDGMLAVLAVEETGFIKAQHGKDGGCTQLERSRSEGFREENRG